VGTGKTWLMRTFADEVIAAGAIYCDATGSRVERRLPFGVLSQLFLTTALPAEIRGQASRLLEADALAVHSRHSGVEDTEAGEIPSNIVHNLRVLLLDLIGRTGRPLIMAVDNAHHADRSSLHCLSSVMGRLSRAPVMLVIGAAVGPQPFDPMFLADLPPEPHCRHIRLDPLSRAGVGAMVAGRLGEETARRLAADCHRISGGNPALVRGLIDDYCRPGDELRQWHLTVGPESVQALLGILHRSDESLLRVARWLALLGDSGTVAVAGHLAGLDGEPLARTAAALNHAGVLDEGRFRHPKLRAAVLDGVTPEQQASMHARAAELLRLEGAPGPVIADHLLGTDGRPEAKWAVPVLNDAADQALTTGDVRRALSYLRLAHHLADGETPRAVTRALLARAEWRIDPALAMRHDAGTATTETEEASTDRMLPLASRLMWFGRADEARAVLWHAGTQGTSDKTRSARLDALRAWLSWLFPTSAEALPMVTLAEEPQQAAAVRNPIGQGISLLVSALTDITGESSVAAEHVLLESRLEEQTLPLLISALAALICTGRLGAAAKWCDSLQQDPAAQQAPTWSALFGALRAMTALRQGNVATADAHARAALVLIPASSWGIGVGIPLSVCIQASTVMGKYDDAFGHLRTPVPDALFETPFGLLYLHARGRFHYAREDFHSALRDFQSVGQLAAQWQMDFPVLTTWRIDAAMAHLRLGQPKLAQELAVEQLKRLAPTQVRERGIALRAVAACSDLPKRPIRLNQAVKELQNSGDRLELAYALGDLSQVYHALGEIGQARRLSRRAYQIAKQCGARVLTNTLLPVGSGGREGPVESERGAAPAALYAGLSQAERRVAALAADGYSNRQIASKLFVTVSTIEQHLTRVYSKLKVSKRGDLPLDLLQETDDGCFPSYPLSGRRESA
jgi:DNA-binding CsgD family transcriptional regulator